MDNSIVRNAVEGYVKGVANKSAERKGSFSLSLAEAELDQDRLGTHLPEVTPLVAAGSGAVLFSAFYADNLNPALRGEALQGNAPTLRTGLKSCRPYQG